MLSPIHLPSPASASLGRPPSCSGARRPSGGMSVDPTAPVFILRLRAELPVPCVPAQPRPCLSSPCGSHDFPPQTCLRPVFCRSRSKHEKLLGIRGATAPSNGDRTVRDVMRVPAHRGTGHSGCSSTLRFRPHERRRQTDPVPGRPLQVRKCVLGGQTYPPRHRRSAPEWSMDLALEFCSHIASERRLRG